MHLGIGFFLLYRNRRISSRSTNRLPTSESSVVEDYPNSIYLKGINYSVQAGGVQFFP